MRRPALVLGFVVLHIGMSLVASCKTRELSGQTLSDETRTKEHAAVYPCAQVLAFETLTFKDGETLYLHNDLDPQSRNESKIYMFTKGALYVLDSPKVSRYVKDFARAQSKLATDLYVEIHPEGFSNMFFASIRYDDARMKDDLPLQNWLFSANFPEGASRNQVVFSWPIAAESSEGYKSFIGLVDGHVELKYLRAPRLDLVKLTEVMETCEAFLKPYTKDVYNTLH